MAIIRVDGKCGRIVKKITSTSASGRFKVQSVNIKLDEGPVVNVGIGSLAASDKFMRMTADQMGEVLKKPFHGRRLGERVCISDEEPVYVEPLNICKRR